MKKLLALGAIIAGLFLISKKSKAQDSKTPVRLPVTFPNPNISQGGNNNSVTPGTGDIVVTEHDYNYDYKRVSGVWYTKKKTANAWIDMKKALSADNYKTAIAKLEIFLSKKTRKITIS